MPTAYVLINYDIGTEENFIDKRYHNTTHKNNRYNQVDDDNGNNRIEKKVMFPVSSGKLPI